MNCPRCGADVGYSRSCPKCGYQMFGGIPQAAEGSPARAKKRFPVVPVAIVASVLVAVTVVLVVVFMTKGGNGNPNGAASPSVSTSTQQSAQTSGQTQAAVSGPAATATTATSSATMVPYTIAGMTIDVPSDWESVQRGDDTLRRSAIFSSPTPGAVISVTATYFDVLAGDLNSGDQESYDVDVQLYAIASVGGTESGGYALTDPQPMSDGPANAVSYISTIESGPGGAIGTMTMYACGPWFYTVTAQSTATGLATYKDVFLDSVGGITIANV